MRSEHILMLLGLSSMDRRVIDMLQIYGAKRYSPALNEENPEVITDWFPNAELGIEFGFKDEAYLKGLDSRLRRKGPLIFYEVIYYGEHPRMKSFKGELPFGLTWTDSKDITQSKMNRFHRFLRSYKRDVWEFSDYRLVVTYISNDSAIADIVIYIPDAPWQEFFDCIHLLPSLIEIRSLFGKTPFTPEFERVFRPFGVMYHLDPADVERHIDVREEFGFELHFAEAVCSSGARDHKERVLSGITMYRERDMDARGWRGEMPFGIEWNDSPPVIFAKVGDPPIKKFEDNMSGSVFWDFAEFSLQVMYSTFDNLPYRLTMSRPDAISQKNTEQKKSDH